MTHQEYADSLRQVASFFEAHPEVPLPYPIIKIYNCDTKQDAINIAKALGKCEKNYSGEMLSIGGKVGGITIEGVFYRSSVCERVIVGKKVVPERIMPAVAEKIIPATEEEIFEWRCHPILDGKL